MKNAILSTTKLCKTFSNGGQQQHVLKNLDLEVYEGDFTVIMGPSGAGKSTLLYALSGMDKPTLGTVSFLGQNISELSNDGLAIFRRNNCGFVFQQPYLLDNMSILDNVIICGLLVGKDRKTTAEQAKSRLASVGLTKRTRAFRGNFQRRFLAARGNVRALRGRLSTSRKSFLRMSRQGR